VPREVAHLAFLQHPKLPAPHTLELTDVASLLALLVEGLYSETVTNLLAAPAKRDQTMKIWAAWHPFLSHHPKFPIGAALAKKEIFKILATAYTSPLARDDAAEYIRAYAESALSAEAFETHTDLTALGKTPMVRTPPPAVYPQTPEPPLIKPVPSTGVRPSDGGTSQGPTTPSPYPKYARGSGPRITRTPAVGHTHTDPPTSARLPLTQPDITEASCTPTSLSSSVTAPRA
jgi:hypothetical protein